ncbi:MAG: hypothetical protein GTO41_11255, partial [Burkholderiales bacterium]|nr:hypothetical protein [Burkholderiales bacterium]
MIGKIAVTSAALMLATGVALAQQQGGMDNQGQGMSRQMGAQHSQQMMAGQTMNRTMTREMS